MRGRAGEEQKPAEERGWGRRGEGARRGGRGLWQRSGCRLQLAHVRGEHRRRCTGPARRVGARGEATCGTEPSGAQLLLFMLRSREAHTARLWLAGSQPWAAGRGEAGRDWGAALSLRAGPVRSPQAGVGPRCWARGVVSLGARRSFSAVEPSSVLALLGRPCQSSGLLLSLFHLENNSEIPEKG